MTHTAQWHMDEAERLYEKERVAANTYDNLDLRSYYIAQAQYHATMAVAVSTKPKPYVNAGPG